MTPEEIKQELERRGWSIVSFAEQLGVGASTLRNALAGHTPMTKALENHISLALGKREAIMVYRVDIDSKKVEELTAGRGCVTEADHKAALDAIIHSNLQELIRLGATLDWTPAERQALGLPPADAPGYEEAAQTLAPEEKVMADYVEQCKAAAHLSADELRELERLQVAPVVPAAAAGVKRADAKGERSLEEKFAAVTKQYSRVVRQEGDRVVVEFGAGPDPSLLKKKKPFVRRGGHKNAVKWDFSESGKKQD